MNKYKVFYISLLFLIIQTSCTTTKEILMFQESENNPVNISIPPSPEFKVKPFDNLYISISTLDPEVNRIFNPSNVGQGFSSGTSSNFGDPASQYINGYRVTADSIISLPILGDINLVGLTLEKAEERVKLKAEEYLKEPSVKVKYLNYKINMIGEIRSPGTFFNYEGSINILEAISRTSGITDFADLKNVIVKRKVENNIFTYKIDLTNNSVYTSEVFYLQPDDLVYIPPSMLKRRSVNSDTYGRLLGTISTLLVAAAFFLRF